MPKAVVDMIILMALFAPLLLAVFFAHDAAPGQTSVLELDAVWQLMLVAALVLPMLVLRRLRLLKSLSDEPSLME